MGWCRRLLQQAWTTFSIALLLAAVSCASTGRADTPVLQIQIGDEMRRFSATELLAHPAMRPLEITRDASYTHPMRYQAIPVLDLLRGLTMSGVSTLEARAMDGFVAQLPWSLIAQGDAGRSVAWIAVEDPLHPWPQLRDRPYSAGPFYLVWERPELSGVTSEQWPYALVSLTSVPETLQRWPQLSIGADVAKDHPARHGQTVYLAMCLPCHRLHGAGEGTVGPDLGQPMPAVSYLTDEGLRRLIRNPAGVRTWPQQLMPAFDAAALPDADIEAVIAYLRLVSGRSEQPAPPTPR